MTIKVLLDRINENILNPIILILFAVALLVFFWGIFNFIAGAGSEEARTKGKSAMMWGIRGLLVMIAVYGILQIVLRTFGIDPPSYLGY